MAGPARRPQPDHGSIRRMRVSTPSRIACHFVASPQKNRIPQIACHFMGQPAAIHTWTATLDPLQRPRRPTCRWLEQRATTDAGDSKGAVIPIPYLSMRRGSWPPMTADQNKLETPLGKTSAKAPSPSMGITPPRRTRLFADAKEARHPYRVRQLQSQEPPRSILSFG